MGVSQDELLSVRAMRRAHVMQRWLRLPWPKAVLGAALLSGLAGCDQSGPTLVVVVGGLGSNQLGDLSAALQGACPDAKVISAGEWDGYKADIDAITAANPHGRLVLVGHSMGCEAVSRAAAHLDKVDLTVFIDPAPDDFAMSDHINKHLWFRRSDFGFERKANIVGADSPKIVHGGHNGIPHSAELIAEVVGAVKDISRPSNANGNLWNMSGKASAAAP